MPIKLGDQCHKRKSFAAAHSPNAVLSEEVIGPLVPPAFEVGADFFDVRTKDQLQEIIDTTCKMIKKLTFSGGNAAGARTLILDASSDGKTTYTVRWGLHQSQDRPAGFVGKCRHFTIIGNPTDWHFYVNTDGKKVSFMSDGAGAAHMTAIKK